MDADKLFDDDYVARLLKKDAIDASKKYDMVGLDAFTKKRLRPEAPKPDTSFLRHIIRQTDRHNAALRAKETKDSRARLREMDTGPGHESAHDRTSRHRNSDAGRLTPPLVIVSGQGVTAGAVMRNATADAGSNQGIKKMREPRGQGGKHQGIGIGTEGSGRGNMLTVRRQIGHRESRCAHTVDAAPNAMDTVVKKKNAHGAKSILVGDTEGGDPRQGRSLAHALRRPFGADITNPQSAMIGLALPDERLEAPMLQATHESRRDTLAPPMTTPIRSRQLNTEVDMDARFASSYDPTMDVQVDSDNADEWGDALEAFRDRQRWKQQGAERLKAAGFSDEQVKKWEQGDEKTEEDVRWAARGQAREWDRGKVVDVDGDIAFKAAWG
ncbi:hypothetical protein N0V90_012870 [Kalmusia sp. IMI 367209]|nr:hypothetical protein N0V90_012870 [Kalmusia sp. IMI 367209]